MMFGNLVNIYAEGRKRPLWRGDRFEQAGEACLERIRGVSPFTLPCNQIDSAMAQNTTDPKSNPLFTFTLRRGRIIFVIVMIITVLAVVWPGHALFAAPEPFIFGFPLSFAWVILWVFVSFAAMTGLYLADLNHENKDL